MSLAHAITLRAPAQQLCSAQIGVLGEVLRDEVNLACWQRQLPVQISDFCHALLAQGDALAASVVLELASPEEPPKLHGLVDQYSDLPGQAAFLADVAWLVSAFAYLVDARRIGLRLRLLDKAMCPRFHVDHVPLRLITSYAGIGSQWLEEGVIPRQRLGDPAAEPQDATRIHQAQAGDVLLAKGEKWVGNEGHGLIHRSPQPPAGEQRLLLTLDWLG
ncbi:MAG: DUF1826 domain-containing protein [Gammaproteobacteria bacterium]|nr:DUF1826 domain-containing protein [Gammaproteobacteria bacterium]MBU1490059.1 DUF1826 domain-containing protein [Gammaproteobacteria bacterium]MBU2066641.1 DUF1826 domain-containing protein [Gammaproteobacteria bacterium]MBU2138800.1 DUF1826 domain-containing protein [Gammaproteobacteria bacterium]MBU2216143.1 DUF1826 domain-containing protein [Gammaproteobacteria bacterium]